MPEIDVSEVLSDSEIAGEDFIVIRRPEIVDGTGESTAPAPQIQAYGSVVPMEQNDLVRTEDYDAQNKTIEIHTEFRLRGVSQDPNGAQYKPDLVLWKGDYYVVKSVEDFSQYGAGFIRALCSSTDFVDQAPI